MLDLVGNRYGSLVVMAEQDRKPHKNSRPTRYFSCKCDCGGVHGASLANLRSGKVISCGCKSSRHYGYGTRIYRIWRGIVQRCTISTYAPYKNYGARGIKVCEDWLEFKKFRAWAMSSGYADALSIDRVDNNGHYEPSNCRWATPAEQARNKRSNVVICYKGKPHIATELAMKLGVKYTTLLYRHYNHKELAG